MTQKITAFRCALLCWSALCHIARAQENAICAANLEPYELAEGLYLSQEIVDDNTRITITLTYEGQGWLGFGFSELGQMVGSTVVIGLPEEPNQEGVNPGRFFLAAKSVASILPVNGRSPEQQGTESPSELETNSPSTPTPTQSTSLTPSWSPTMAAPSAAPLESLPTPSPSDMLTAVPAMVPTLSPTTLVRTLSPSSVPSSPIPSASILPLDSTSAPTSVPTLSPTTLVPTQSPSSVPSSPIPSTSILPLDSMSAPTSVPKNQPSSPPQPQRTPKPTNWWEWRRELRSMADPEMAHKHRTLTIQQARIEQNETHTVLQFTRPLQENGQLWEDSFRTFLYAAGSSNALGYHELRGSGSMELTTQSCQTQTSIVLFNDESPSSGTWVVSPSTFLSCVLMVCVVTLWR